MGAAICKTAVQLFTLQMESRQEHQHARQGQARARAAKVRRASGRAGHGLPRTTWLHGMQLVKGISCVHAKAMMIETSAIALGNTVAHSLDLLCLTGAPVGGF